MTHSTGLSQSPSQYLLDNLIKKLSSSDIGLTPTALNL